MIVRDLIRIFKDEWLPVDTLPLDKKAEVTRDLIAKTADASTLLAYDSMPLWKVRGVGPKKAMDLWSRGVRPGNLRRHLQLLPDSTRIALKYPILERIPRALVERVAKTLLTSRCRVVGSYRRGLPTSGDVDVLFLAKSTATAKQDFEAFLAKLAKRHGDKWVVMAKGASKVAGIFLIDDVAVEVDIWVTTPDNAAAMLLYSTGSKAHNVKMRFIAKHRGLKLNQYGVWRDDTLVPTKTERDIFDVLKIQWRKPEDR